MLDLGKIIARERKLRGYSQFAFAVRVGVTPSTIAAAELKGIKRLPPPGRFLAICEALDLEPDAVLAELGYRA